MGEFLYKKRLNAVYGAKTACGGNRLLREIRIARGVHLLYVGVHIMSMRLRNAGLLVCGDMRIRLCCEMC